MARQAGSSISPMASDGTSTNACRLPSANAAPAATAVRLREVLRLVVAPGGRGAAVYSVGAGVVCVFVCGGGAN